MTQREPGRERPARPRSPYLNPAMAAAWGAAAEVPQNLVCPGQEVTTQSAAVMSGFCRTRPPLARKFPGVMAEPSGL